jgi:hypothetical protein
MIGDRMRALYEASIEAAEAAGEWYDIDHCARRGWMLYSYMSLAGGAVCIDAAPILDEETALIVATAQNWRVADGAAGGRAPRPPLTYLSASYRAAVRESVEKGAVTRGLRESTVVIADVEYPAAALSPALAAQLRESLRRRATAAQRHRTLRLPLDARRGPHRHQGA